MNSMKKEMSMKMSDLDGQQRKDLWEDLKPGYSTVFDLGDELHYVRIARSSAGQRQLHVLLASGDKEEIRLPQIAGLELAVVQSGSDHLLSIGLEDSDNFDIFNMLALDLVNASARAGSRQESRVLCLNRLNRWQEMLRKRREPFTEEKQKGLLGELFFLSRIVGENLGSEWIMTCWQGPQGDPKDYILGDMAVEVKTISPSADAVRISSAKQLSDCGLELFLFVVDAAAAGDSGEKTMTLDDLVSEVLAPFDSGERAILKGKIEQVGYREGEEYGVKPWHISRYRVFQVTGTEFPRLTEEGLPSGIDLVRYRVSLAECEQQGVDLDDFIVRLKRGKGDE